MKRIIALLSAIILLIVITSCGDNDKTKPALKEEDIRAICELSTLKCYYNNVASIEKKKENFLQKDRKMWIEYEGVATIGVDMSKIEINVSEQKVDVIMPKAQVLSIMPVKETLNEKSYVVSEDGVIFKNKITTEDQEKAIVKGQKEMEEMINSNSELFLRAEIRAQELIENYVDKLGELIGVEYEVSFEIKGEK